MSYTYNTIQYNLLFVTRFNKTRLAQKRAAYDVNSRYSKQSHLRVITQPKNNNTSHNRMNSDEDIRVQPESFSYDVKLSLGSEYLSLCLVVEAKNSNEQNYRKHVAPQRYNPRWKTVNEA